VSPDSPYLLTPSEELRTRQQDVLDLQVAEIIDDTVESPKSSQVVDTQDIPFELKPSVATWLVISAALLKGHSLDDTIVPQKEVGLEDDITPQKSACCSAVEADAVTVADVIADELCAKDVCLEDDIGPQKRADCLDSAVEAIVVTDVAIDKQCAKEFLGLLYSHIACKEKVCAKTNDLCITKEICDATPEVHSDCKEQSKAFFEETECFEFPATKLAPISCGEDRLDGAMETQHSEFPNKAEF